MATTTTPGLFNLSLQDFFRGLLIAVITTPITIILQSLNEGSLTFDWKSIGAVALAGALSYIIKNIGTPAEVVIKDATKEQVQAVKDGSAEAIIVSK